MVPPPGMTVSGRGRDTVADGLPKAPVTDLGTCDGERCRTDGDLWNGPKADLSLDRGTLLLVRAALVAP